MNFYTLILNYFSALCEKIGRELSKKKGGTKMSLSSHSAMTFISPCNDLMSLKGDRWHRNVFIITFCPDH